MSTGGTNELEKRNEGDTLLGRGFPGMDERGSEGFSNGLEGGFCGGGGVRLRIHSLRFGLMGDGTSRRQPQWVDFRVQD